MVRRQSNRMPNYFTDFVQTIVFHEECLIFWSGLLYVNQIASDYSAQISAASPESSAFWGAQSSQLLLILLHICKIFHDFFIYSCIFI